MRIPDPLLCARFAPILRFDAREQCFPSAVETFLQNVDLCRRRLLTPLDGDPPVWVTTTFFSGDAKVLAIRAPAPEALIGCGYAPGGAESSTGPGTSDFFLRERSTKARGGTPPSPSGQPPIYVSAVGDGDLIELSYWLFCPYNPAFGPFAHVGDWEHVVVRLDAQGRLLGVLYHYHADAQWTWAPDHPERPAGAIVTPLAEGRPVVYCARGSHASYWTSDPPKRLPFGLGTDRADGRGHVIDSARNLIVVHQDPATGRCPPGQEWVRFTGRWGQTFDDGLPLIASSPPGPCVRREAHRVSPGGPGAPPSTTLDDAALHYRPTTCAPSASVSTGYAIT